MQLQNASPHESQPAVPVVHVRALIGEVSVDDALYLGLTTLFFLVALVVVKGVDRL